MVAPMFLADWRRMKADGLDPTVEDAIRLNALAVRAKLAGRPFSHAHLRRAVFLTRDIELREPTIAHDLWIERVSRYFDMDDNLVFRLVHAFALSREAKRLPDPSKAQRTVRDVFRFARKLERDVTRDTLADAVDYALFGADWKVGELAPRREDDAHARERSPAVGVVLGAISRRLPLSIEDVKRMTASEVIEATLAAIAADGHLDPDMERNDALADYFAARDEIKERLKRSKGGQQ